MANETETVLLVDDEEIVIGVGRQMLEKLGFSVLTAASGREAIDIYKVNKDRIGLVVLDMIMPGMGAGDTYNGLQAIDPAIKVLLSSGYGVDEQTNEILQRGCKGFIQKPFNMQVLSDKIEEVMKKA
ncbi:MAG: response regulator [Desulfobacteraceae bacterium]|jgi:DNA-binding NtrC family response regulator|nr:response regulator [Desulfobacteraceae bacterium]